MVKSWRSGSKNTFTARPIYTKDFPKLIKKMKEDGLLFMLDNGPKGYRWIISEYEISAKAIREVWGLTKSQYSRLIEYSIIHYEVWEWE